MAEQRNTSRCSDQPQSRDRKQLRPSEINIFDLTMPERRVPGSIPRVDVAFSVLNLAIIFAHFRARMPILSLLRAIIIIIVA